MWDQAHQSIKSQSTKQFRTVKEAASDWNSEKSLGSTVQFLSGHWPGHHQPEPSPAVRVAWELWRPCTGSSWSLTQLGLSTPTPHLRRLVQPKGHRFFGDNNSSGTAQYPASLVFQLLWAYSLPLFCAICTCKWGIFCISEFNTCLEASLPSLRTAGFERAVGTELPWHAPL